MESYGIPQSQYMGRFELEEQTQYSEQYSSNKSEIEIPPMASVDGWKEVPIQESHQELILIDGLNPKILTEPGYLINGIKNALDKIYLRQEAADRLIHAANLLPEGHSLIVFDAYRPITVQQEIFNSYRSKLSKEHPEKDEDTISKMTEIYVSLPSVDKSRPSPHSTGGAIDLSIVQNDYGKLEMGSDWDSFDISSRTDFFREDQNIFHKNRTLLYKVMSQSGFTNYPEEWWHYDFGNQFWGHIIGERAIYGIVEGGDFNG